jgi:hypothetical protein
VKGVRRRHHIRRRGGLPVRRLQELPWRRDSVAGTPFGAGGVGETGHGSLDRGWIRAPSGKARGSCPLIHWGTTLPQP